MLFDRSAVNKRQFNPSTGSGLGVDGARMPGASPRVIIKFNPSHLRYQLRQAYAGQESYDGQATAQGYRKLQCPEGFYCGR